MTHPLSRCNEKCPTMEHCFASGTCQMVDLDSRLQAVITEQTSCPENYTCPTKTRCNQTKLCNEQMLHDSQTVWYGHIVYLRRIIGDHFLWLLSGNIGDHCIVDQWVKFEVAPTDAEKKRLHYAKHWLEFVASLRGEAIAKSWFTRVRVGGICVYEAIQKDLFDLVKTSANEQQFTWAE